MQVDEFRTLIASVTRSIAGKPLDEALEAELNRDMPQGSSTYEQLFSACRAAVQAGWMCNREAGGIKFGRVVKQGPDTHGFSVDVVDMDQVVGPHHSHPNGEIDLIMPLSPNAKFDGRGAGWRVYGPGSAHSPTVSEGRALVLYLLPDGKIDFTQR